jgi:hypothetical protein
MFVGGIGASGVANFSPMAMGGASPTAGGAGPSHGQGAISHANNSMGNISDGMKDHLSMLVIIDSGDHKKHGSQVALELYIMLAQQSLQAMQMLNSPGASGMLGGPAAGGMAAGGVSA